jgi:DsbC/DsbD-like thiol-disulfide interchange protein
MKRQILSHISRLTVSLCLFLAWASFITIHAQTTPPKITTKLSLTTANIERGRSVSATLVLDIPRGYHVNAHDPLSRFALPTKIEVEAPSRIRISSISYPRAIVRRFTFSEDRLRVYENRVIIKFNIVIPPNQQTGKSEIKTRLSYQSCSDEVCFPPQKSENSVLLNVL